MTWSVIIYKTRFQVKEEFLNVRLFQEKNSQWSKLEKHLHKEKKKKKSITERKSKRFETLTLKKKVCVC